MACTDPVITNLWHVLGPVAELTSGVQESILLEERIALCLDGDQPRVWRMSDPSKSLPVQCAFGYVWTTFGDDPSPLFAIDEIAEPDRRNCHTCTVGVAVSAPRAVENFLDMGHFPFVHTGILGEEPHTEVQDYSVSIDSGEVLATDCLFWQPQAAVNATGGARIDYIYRVPHPYCAVLYKTAPQNPDRNDVIALFVQPVSQDQVRANILMSIIDDESNETEIRAFQLTIFGQDKPILENQLPKRLPLDPRAETPIRADKTSVAYRRWLAEKDVRYGVIPIAA